MLYMAFTVSNRCVEDAQAETVMRSVMDQERLGELWTLACERNLTDTIDLDEIANPWTKLTKRGHLIKIRCLTANCTYSCKIPNK